MGNTFGSISDTLDARGLFCPEPVFRTKIEIERMQVGQTKIALEKLQLGSVLQVLSDDPASEDDISRWVNRNGHELINIQKNDQYLEFLIKKRK